MSEEHVLLSTFYVFIQADFQAVIVTDGSISFTLYIYSNFLQLVQDINFLRVPVEIGFDEGNAIGSFEQSEISPDSELLFRTDG